MNPSETTKLMALLKGAFPRQDVTPETLQVYCEFLADLDFNTAKDAIKRIVSTSRFWPTIAEIRDACLAEQGLLPPEEAWAFVSVRNLLKPTGGWPSPEIAEAVRVAGGNWAWTHTDNPAAVRNTFLETYSGLRLSRGADSKHPALAPASKVPLLKAGA